MCRTSPEPARQRQLVASGESFASFSPRNVPDRLLAEWSPFVLVPHYQTITYHIGYQIGWSKPSPGSRAVAIAHPAYQPTRPKPALRLPVNLFHISRGIKEIRCKVEVFTSLWAQDYERCVLCCDRCWRSSFHATVVLFLLLFCLCGVDLSSLAFAAPAALPHCR